MAGVDVKVVVVVGVCVEVMAGVGELEGVFVCVGVAV